MFGYVTINKPELKIREFQRYQGYYCGICRSLRLRYGFSGQMALNYDMVFLAALLTGLYEGEEYLAMRRCVLHPAGKHLSVQNPYIDYAADMTVLLAWHNLMDDWQDDKNACSLAAAGMLKKKCGVLKGRYPRQWRAAGSCIQKLHGYEKEKSADLDGAAGCMGELLGEILVWKKDQWEESLRAMGFYLGKFIYLMDAYEDLPRDGRRGRYNPLLFQKDRPGFEEWFAQVLTMMMAGCAKEFERLPILKDVAILRNILYAGVWTKYDRIVNDPKSGKKEREKMNGSL
ncbi:MAG: hypothetical protein HFI67_04975 [Lachnospiraceae bacterium]|jgi:hypothetical protein|nr:hypothetical protein [Lachnospiraceae bacterium]